MPSGMGRDREARDDVQVVDNVKGTSTRRHRVIHAAQHWTDSPTVYPADSGPKTGADEHHLESKSDQSKTSSSQATRMFPGATYHRDGSGELLLQHLFLHNRDSPFPKYTAAAYQARTSRACYPLSFTDLANGELPPGIDLPSNEDYIWEFIVCSFALHLVGSSSELFSLLYELSGKTRWLIVITPHKKPEVCRPIWATAEDLAGRSRRLGAGRDGTLRLGSAPANGFMQATTRMWRMWTRSWRLSGIGELALCRHEPVD